MRRTNHDFKGGSNDARASGKAGFARPLEGSIAPTPRLHSLEGGGILTKTNVDTASRTDVVKLVGGGPVNANPGPSWHAIGTDGGSNILLQNASGQISIWEMSGTNIVGGGPVSANLEPSWHAIELT